jgi:nicotinate-nucleotide adenylyltransferase
MNHPKIILSDVEDQARVRFSLDTVRLLKKRAPLAHFVWIMGADNLSHFHRWQGWEEIANLLPIAVIDREEGRFAALNAKAAQGLSGFRLKAENAASLPYLPPPAWVFLHGKHIRLSSSALRKAGKH